MTFLPVVSVAIRREQDLLLVRQRARQISQFLGFSSSDATRITTALSEIGRNAFEYGGGGRADFGVGVGVSGRQELVIVVKDDGVGIASVEAVLAPDFRSRTGMGIGIRGSRVLMDRFEIVSRADEGTTVTMAKTLPVSARIFLGPDVARLAKELSATSDASPFGELQIQNQALLGTLDELTKRQLEIERLGAVADSARTRAEAAQLIAERSLVVRERFMALTTHELRTPLNAIMGYMELLAMDLEPLMTEKQKDYFARVERASKHLLGITNDFLDMAQGDAGGLRVGRNVGAARHVIAEASALVTPQAAARDVALVLVEATEGVTYVGDAARVRQVLVNVLGNAVSFSPKGGSVQVRVAREDGVPEGVALAGGPWCAIRVEDSGPGIPPEKLAHVFEPFVQLSSNGQSTRKGSGLGLTVSRQLAMLMGGELTASSNESGASFTLFLPA
jgi:signal transduction histidine kinase